MDAHRRRSAPGTSGRTRPDGPGPGPSGRPVVYRIRVRGHLDDRWADAPEGLTVTLEATGDTLLTLPVVDQAALHGLLRTLRDLGAPLVSINPAGPDLPGIASTEENER